MSYGVKYRLNFSDESGIPKKLEILKKNYSGSVISMVGSGEPVVIKWTANDDQYSPIIGSSCDITLLETPTINYDEFFDGDEREYLVKVFYQYANAGTAIWNTTQINWNDADFNWNETSVVEQPYWSGFIVNDNYQQVVKTQPFEIKLKAFDGLGLLDAYDMALPTTDAVSDAQNIFYYVYTILQNTGLSFPIYYSNDVSFAGANFTIVNNDSNAINAKFIDYTTDREVSTNISAGATSVINNVVKPTLKISGASDINNVTQTESGTLPSYRALEHVFPDVENLYKPGELFNDAKKQLENILKSINARIFQSRNRWYIISNSSYSAQAEKDSIASSASGGTIPANIRATEQLALETNDVEQIQFITFSEQGIFSGIVLTNILYLVETDLQNIGSDLVKIQDKPVKTVNLKMNTQNENRIIFSPNNSFEFTNGFGYTLTNDASTTVTMGTNSIVKTGNKSVKASATSYNQANSITGTYFENSVNLHQAVSNNVMPNKVRFSLYLDVADDFSIDADDPQNQSNVFGTDLKFIISYQFKFTVGSHTYFYRESDNTYVKNATVNNQLTFFKDDINKWITHEVSNIPVDDASDDNDSNTNTTMILQMSKLSSNIEDGFNGIYFDDVYFAFEPSSQNNIVYNREVSDSFTGKINFDFDYTGHNTAKAYFRPRDNNPSTYKQLNEITSQQILNDNRSKVTSFEGTFRNRKSDGDPVGFESKVFVTFSTQASQFAPVSGIIDQMTYSVKSNRYKLKFRLPNQDNDKTNTLTIKED
ncbi:MAG: hypothetical protein Tp123DCM300541_9 [Prokaryotic dsDNA virus sp.]|nr:MAG: hypothetical protein Tp123DCM300541_9 [Prokaryotic dsDNA virus sp.]QDP53808.1 MAG: hypothetical protein Tp125DCM6481_33 [Prokaryotic dsDNA virus sp.]|tara:strand:+ start:8011 stop:10311 length:2301 start_codon:yes stop_codon:yes gene_type:complete